MSDHIIQPARIFRLDTPHKSLETISWSASLSTGQSRQPNKCEEVSRVAQSAIKQKNRTNHGNAQIDVQLQGKIEKRTVKDIVLIPRALRVRSS